MMKGFSIAICLLICQFLSYECDATGLVEIYVAIDRRVIDDYINHGSAPADAEGHARSDAEYFLTEVNNMFQSTGTDIGIHIRRMDVLSEDVFNDCQLRDGEGIHEDLGLQTFQRYVEDQGLYSSLAYDMALLWTGYNIYGKDDKVAGYATVGSVCKQNSVSMVEYDGTYRTVHVTAHEIGHVLGLEHDEGDCANGHIMTDTLSVSTQRWTFSSCSIAHLSDLIPGMACITEQSSDSVIPDEMPGDSLLDPDAVCRRSQNNTESYMCKSWNLYNNLAPQGDLVCERFYCYDPVTGYCYSGYPTNGMVCGETERCSNEECVTAPDDFPTPTGLDADCLYGDSEVLSLSGGLTTTCQDFFAVESNRFQCYSSTIEKACCETCESLKGDIPGCDYGDRSSQCVLYSQNSVCPSYKDSLCCEHCSDWTAKRSADSNETPPLLKATKKVKTERQNEKKENEGEGTRTSE